MLKQIRKPQINLFSSQPQDLVKEDHPYRKLLSIINFAELTKPLESLYNKEVGRPGFHIESGFAALVLQWMEDLSDRELERFLTENIAAKFFCGFDMTEKTPDHTYFCELRKKISTPRLGKMFTLINNKLRNKGLISDIFTFVDASSMISKIALWNERDKAIKAGEEQLNNKNVNKFTKDKDASYGCKGENKHWYGYKRNVAVCMKHGFITKVAATTAKVTDAKALKYICPKGGMVIADKGYCTNDAAKIMAINDCHNGAIKKNNMKLKNHQKDNFISGIRMPYESTFSKMDKRVRYYGLAKVQFQAFMQSLAHNFKRLIAIDAPPIFV